MSQKHSKESGNRKQNSKQQDGVLAPNSKVVDTADSDSIWNCGKCQINIISDKEQALVCEVCDGKFCLKCTNFSISEYKHLRALPRDDVWWICENCIVIVKEKSIHYQTVQSIEKKIVHIEQKFSSAVDEIKSSLVNLNTSVVDSIGSKIEIEINKSVTEKTLTKSFSEAVKASSSTNIDQIAAKVKETIVPSVSVVMQEQRVQMLKDDTLREERAKNVVIHKMPELSGNNREARFAHDKENVQKIMEQLGVDLEPKNIFRLGRFDHEKDQDGKCRPLRLIFESKEDRDRVLRNRYKLGEWEDESPLKKVQLNYDLSKEERQEVNNKLSEAKTKTNSQEEYFWKVRGPPWALWFKRENKIQK